MTCIISEELRFARTQFLLDLAEQNGGKVTPEEFLAAVGGKQKLILNILWIVRRSGYATVEQVRDGRKIAYWEVKVTGPKPNVKGALFVAEAKAPKSAAKSAAKTKTKDVKPKAVKTAAPKKAKVKTEEEIRAANLKTMQKVTAKLNKKNAKKKTKRIDVVENELGSSGEIATSFSVDGDWDSVENLDIKTLIAA